MRDAMTVVAVTLVMSGCYMRQPMRLTRELGAAPVCRLGRAPDAAPAPAVALEMEQAYFWPSAHRGRAEVRTVGPDGQRCTYVYRITDD